VYGSTEAEPIAHLECREITTEDRLAMLAGRGLLAGRPVAEIKVRIVCERWGRPIPPLSAGEFEGMALPAGEAGEIVVSGSHVLPGYLHGHGDEETKFRVDGQVWHRTGDAGWLDTMGRLWLLGRCSAKVNDSRGVLWPFAVECAAQQNSAVRRAALIACDGRRVLAIEPGAGISRMECEQLKKTLVWAALDEVRMVARLPVDRRHNAKIDYPALQKMLNLQGD
jgi:olefin beta-lactone synthetase